MSPSVAPTPSSAPKADRATSTDRGVSSCDSQSPLSKCVVGVAPSASCGQIKVRGDVPLHRTKCPRTAPGPEDARASPSTPPPSELHASSSPPESSPSVASGSAPPNARATSLISCCGANAPEQEDARAGLLRFTFLGLRLYHRRLGFWHF